MKNKPLLYLFLSSFIILFVGMGLFPVLPLYDAQFGATRTVIGVHFALMYVANTLGHMLTGWLADRLTPRGAFVGAGVLGIPVLVLLGQATGLWQVIVLTAAAWFLGGLGRALVNVFIGLHANGKSRAISFSLAFLAYPLGAAFGGGTIGQLVTWQGYPFMFAVLGAVWAVLPAIGLLGLKGRPVSRLGRTAPMAEPSEHMGLGRIFTQLLAVSFLSATAINVSRLGLPLSMQALDFPPSAITGASVVSGLATAPVVLLIGALSDRLGRKRFLALVYVLAAGGALVLIAARELWHFWLAATAMLVALCANGALTSALAADMLSREALRRRLPWITTVGAFASVLSFAGAGYVMDAFGASTLYLVAAGLAGAAALQLSRLPRKSGRLEATLALEASRKSLSEIELHGRSAAGQPAQHATTGY
jgi:MFS family permease